jgi:hypothetical protein
MSQFYDEYSADAEREQKQCLYQYWKEFETGKPLSYRERKREEYELSQGRLITVAYKGVMMHIDFETDLEKEYQSIINKQNKMKTSKIKSIQNDGTWKDLFKFEVQMENGDVGGAFAKTQIPSWKVGDEKSYEYEQKGKFWNIKFLADAKPAWNGGSSAPKSYGKSPEDKADIARAVALKAAVDLHKGEGEPMEKQIGIICATAQAFEIYLTTGDNPYKDAIMDGKMSNADDLPF